MKQNRPIVRNTVKRAPDVRGQINAAAKERKAELKEDVKFL